MKRLKLFLLISGLLMIILPYNAIAQEPEGALEITVAGNVVMRIRSEAAGYTMQERANIVWENLVLILSQTHIDYSLIKSVKLDKNNYAIVAQTHQNMTSRSKSRYKKLKTFDPEIMHLIAVVRPIDAKAENTNVKGLSEVWAQNFRIAIPQANYKPNMCQIKPGSCPIYTGK